MDEKKLKNYFKLQANDENQYFNTINEYLHNKDPQVIGRGNEKDMEILMTNHLILENLWDENERMSREISFLRDENLVLEKTNSSI